MTAVPVKDSEIVRKAIDLHLLFLDDPGDDVLRHYEYSCNAINYAANDLGVGSQGWFLRSEYGDLFKKSRFHTGAWLTHNVREGKDTTNFRLTALSLFADMLEAEGR